MRRSGLFAAALTAGLVPLTVGATPASADDIGTFPGGTSVHAARDSPTRAIFPLELTARVDASKVKAHLISVRQDDIPAKDLRQSVRVKVKPRFPLVKVVLKDPQPEVGEYEITVQLRYGEQRQLVTFTFTRESVELSAPTSVEVEQDDAMHLLALFKEYPDDAVTDNGSVTLRIGPHDRLTAGDLHVVESDAVKGSVCGDLTFEDAATSGSTIDLALSPSGVALGESVHTCEITSPKLAEPVSISVTISRQRSLAWIGVLVLLGVAAGFGVRQFLGPLLTRTRAELALAEIRDTIVRAMDRVPGQIVLLMKLQAALDIADRVPSGASVADIEKATTEAVAAYNEAVQAGADAAPGGPGAGGPQLERYGERKRQLKRQVVLIELLRYALLTVVLVLTAYGLYADTWVGTWQQVVAVLSWAFALDVTVSAVQGEMGKAAPGR
jgi:hypothetical protein